MGPLENNSIDNHSRRNLGFVNPNDPFTYMMMTLWTKMSFTYGPSMLIGNFLSNVNVRFTTPTMTIPNVQVKHVPSVHENFVAKSNVNDIVE